MDPYYEWLGIAPNEQPPNHYRLLGISLFESNPQVIESAVNQRMNYLQQLTGDSQHVDDAQRIMGEVSRARLILLKEEKRAAYDARLKQLMTTIPAIPTPQQSVGRELGAKRRGQREGTDAKPLIKVNQRFFTFLFLIFILCVVAFYLTRSKEHHPQAKSSQNTEPSSGLNKEERDARPVSPLFRSPTEVAGPQKQLPPTKPSPIDAGQEENAFIIGSKRDESAGENSSLPSPENSIIGDLEDRVTVQVVDDGFLFTFDDEGKLDSVSLVGSFNSWNSKSSPMKREGRYWKIFQQLSPIRHEYKFRYGNGDWYPPDDNLILDQQRMSFQDGDSGQLNTQNTKGGHYNGIIKVLGDHQGRVEVTESNDGLQFRLRNDPPQAYALLLGDFNSWNHTVGGMQREGNFWVATKSLPPGDYSFKFLGPNENWFPAGENLTLSYRRQSPSKHVHTNPSPAESRVNPQRSPRTPGVQVPEPENTISTARAREYLNDAGLYEGKPGVWFFPQSNRLVIRQYGRIAKDPKIRKSLKKLGDRLPNPAEMENPPPQQR